MDPKETNNENNQIERVEARDRMADFERQFRDPEHSNRLKEGLSIEKVMEAAGLSKKEWKEIPIALHPWIFKAGRTGAYGISARPWETHRSQMIFGRADNTFYFVQKRGHDYAWTRLWIDGDTPRIEPMNHDSSLSEVITSVAYHEFGEKPQTEHEEVGQTRNKLEKTIESQP